VLASEHRLYPLALAMLADGKVRMEGGRAVFADFADEPASGRVISAPMPKPQHPDMESLARFTP
jgi:phosphoribosylglycinamide formyltransferase-1